MGVIVRLQLTDMKRLVASIVIALLLASSGLPLTAGMATQSDHACCRAHGAHHCVTPEPSDSGTAFTTACPHHAGKLLIGNTAVTLLRRSFPAPVDINPLIASSQSSASNSSLLQRSGRAPPSLI